MNYLVLLLSIVLGLIPEAIFFAAFVTKAKEIKGQDRWHFYILCIFIFVVIGTLFSYNIWYYIAIPFCLYIILKVIYKQTEFIDLFLLTIPFLLLALLRLSVLLCSWVTA